MKTYTVQSGDTLTTIARKTLGDGKAWRLLAEQNRISNPGDIRVGQVLRLPIDEYRVQRGDTLSAIARKMLGDSNRWQELAQYNNIRNARDLRVGMVLKIPPTAKQSSAGQAPTHPALVNQALVNQATNQSAAHQSVTSKAPTHQSTSTYRVQTGDTLTSIARKTLGDGNRWRDIARLNNISNPSAMRVGMVLQIPAQLSQPQPSTSSSSPTSPSTPPPSAPKPPTIQPKTYRVQRGDSLIRIAQTTLGNGNRWREIARLNNIANASNIRVGQVLKLPQDATLPPGPASQPAPSQPTPSQPTPSQPVPVPGSQSSEPSDSASGNTYTVQPGDSLIRIAQKTLGDGNRWREIARLNKITNARDIRVGQVLRIPSTSTSTSTSATSSQDLPADAPTTSVYKTYRIQPGDSLIGIAQKTLGDGNRWREIAKLNSITNARDIRVGQVLKLPILVSEAPLPGTVQLPPPPAVPVASSTSGELSKYSVQSGDTLSQIAAGQLGDRNRWTEIAVLNGIDNPSNISVGQVLRLPDKGPGALVVVPPLNTSQGKQSSSRSLVRFVQSQDNLMAEWVKGAAHDRETVGVRYRQGLFRRGRYKARDVVDRERSLLSQLRLSNSEMNVIAAVSENEGYLDAINTWDSQYLSFGLFQWTAGSPDRPGELAELLTQLKQRYPEEFSHYWGQFGLDVDGTDGIRGWLSLNGKRLTSDDQKSILRLPIWAYRFAIAGSDPLVQAMQIIHAITRLDKFYFVRQSSLEGYSLSRLITSELGVALLLDNHVNRPAFVAPGLAEALWQLGLSPQDLAQADTDEERRVIERYLIIRETFGSRPMSHARHRAGRIKRQMSDGRLSAERGSFLSNRTQRRA